MYLRMILICDYIIADVFVIVNRNDSYLGQNVVYRNIIVIIIPVVKM